MKSTIEILPNGIVSTQLKASNDVNEIMEWVMSLKKTIKEVFDKSGPVKVLTDLSMALLPADFLPKELIINLQKGNKDFVKKSAAFGGDIQLDAAAGMIGQLSGRENFQLFKTKEEALKWLGQE